MRKTCQVCGAEGSYGARYCAVCSTQIAPSEGYSNWYKRGFAFMSDFYLAGFATASVLAIVFTILSLTINFAKPFYLGETAIGLYTKMGLAAIAVGLLFAGARAILRR